MNREAAALGIPVYSIFRGKIGAVDRQLVNHGRLILIESCAEVHEKIKFERRSKQPARQAVKRAALEQIVQHVQDILKIDGRRGIELPAKLRDAVLAND